MGSIPRFTLIAVIVVIANLAQIHSGSEVRTSCLDPEWSASRYLVENLPNVTFQLPLNWAGQISVPGIANDELFFWLFEAEDQAESDNFIIWLNGGPGCSSLNGLTKENGPLHFSGNSVTPSTNPNSWTKLANVLYIDQPVGTGYSNGPTQATMNSQVTQDFVAWLGAFYEIFPALKSKDTYLMGESYAGIYIPYFTQAMVGNTSLPNKIKGIAIGDGIFGNDAAQTDVVVTKYMQDQNEILDIPAEILHVFYEAHQKFGFEDILSKAIYPPAGKLSIPGNPEGDNFRLKKRQNDNCAPNPTTPALIDASMNECNGGNATFTTALNYLNSTRPCFSPYNIVYNCTNTPDTTAFVKYFNRPDVRKAIHAPNKTFADCNSTVFAPLNQEFVEPPAYNIMPAILAAGIGIHIYAGDYDFLLDHYGSELAIQNMTWGGKQGFPSKPDKPFMVDGVNMGNWGCERGLSYHHILKAGHAVPYDQPEVMSVYVRDFVIGKKGCN